MSGNSWPTVLVQGCPEIQEAIANTTGIKPGHYLKRNTDGTVDVHGSAASAVGALILALENTEVGGGIDDAYGDAETVKFAVCAPGEKYNVLLKTGENVDIGEFMESAGDGTFQARTSGKTLMQANEAYNNSSGSAGRILATVV